MTLKTMPTIRKPGVPRTDTQLLPKIALPAGGILGVDPGSTSGCLAYVTDRDAQTFPIGELTDAELWDTVRQIAAVATFAVIERVHAMPLALRGRRQGVSSSFKFGASYGALRLALAASGLRWSMVLPAVWQKAMGCLSKGDKRVTRDAAQRLFPGVRVTQRNADSLLIAAYGARLHGTLPAVAVRCEACAFGKEAFGPHFSCGPGCCEAGGR